MKKIISIVIALIVVILIYFFYLEFKDKKIHVIKRPYISVAAPLEEILPFIWDNVPPGSTDELDVLKKTGHPLILTRKAYALLYYGYQDASVQKVFFERAKRILNYLLYEYEPAIRNEQTFLLKYGIPTDKLSPGWWSAMSNFFLPVILNDAAILLNEPDYSKYSKLMFNSISRLPVNGGSVWRDKSGCWFSEYTWTGMSESEEYSVLNGHLFALHALYLYFKQTGDGIQLIDCAVKKTKTIMDNFRAPMLNWSYYMLNPKTINQTHYVIFEKMQFEALNKIAPSSLFQKEAAFRAKILEHNYPLVYRRYNDKYQILLNKGGSPHPFIIDTYPIKITCSSNDGAKIENNVKEQLVTPNDTNDTNNRFVVIQTLFRPESCKVESVLPNKDPILYRSYLLYKSKPIFFSSNEIVKILKYDLSAAYNAKKISEKNILISPSHKSKPSEPDNYVNNQGRIILKKINIAELESFIGLELYSKKEVNLGMGLIDNSGEEFFRYYPKLKGESWNLVLLTPVGFNNVEKAKLPFKAINIYIYTHNLHCDPFVINIGDLWTANFQQSFALFHRITSKYNFVVP